MKSERCCGIANVLMSNTQTVYRTFASQRFERTLDDSVARRIILPDSILKTDALLSTLQNIFEGLSVQKNNIARIVADELPFLAMEKALMYLSEAHVDRQLAHEKIRQSAIAAKEKQQHTGHVTIEEMISDSFFDGIRERLLKECSNPINFTGRCVSQTRSFIATARTTIAPLMPIGDEATASMHIDV
jgi:adenylosuccinate lyase